MDVYCKVIHHLAWEAWAWHEKHECPHDSSSMEMIPTN